MHLIENFEFPQEFEILTDEIKRNYGRDCFDEDRSN